jgi:hypothetical protein
MSFLVKFPVYLAFLEAILEYVVQTSNGSRIVKTFVRCPSLRLLEMYKRVLGAPARAMARRAFSTTAVAQVSIAGEPESVCERGRDAAKEEHPALRPRARCAPSPSRGACAQKEVVFVRGARTPFVLSGGEFNDYMAYDLQVWNRC